MKPSRFLLALGLLSPSLAFSQKPTAQDEQAIAEVEYSWCQAFLKGDADALGEIEREGFVLSNSGGIVSTRADDLAEAKSGTTRFTEFSNHETAIRVYGDTAIVTGRTVIAGTTSGKPYQGIFQFTDTLVRNGASWQAVAAQATRITPSASSALEPLPREQGWVKRHDGFVEIAKKGGVDLLFLGDSITDFWRQPERGLTVWEKTYGDLRVANFGISGDRVQHVLWRIQNGELEGIKPKVVVLMIGTNNTGFERDKKTPRNQPPEVIAGVQAIVKTLAAKLPSAKLLLLAVFPRGETAADPSRPQIAEINAALAKLDDGKRIHYLDIGKVFLEPDGTISKEIMPDFLHPTTKGYERWAEAMKEPLAKLLK